MKRTRLSWLQKYSIALECERKGITGGTQQLQKVAQWAAKEFKLDLVPCSRTILRIIRSKRAIECHVNGATANRKRAPCVPDTELEHLVSRWVQYMWDCGVFICDAVIQLKTARVQAMFNEEFGKQGTNSFDKGWVFRFKQRNDFKSHNSHGEEGDADHAAAAAALPNLRQVLSSYSVNDIYNCDEMGVFYMMPPSSTIGPAPLKGWKKKKDRFTVLACTNADGTDKPPPFFIGKARRPLCFNGRTPNELGFDYTVGPKGWMTRSIFFDWLKRFDERIGSTPGRKALLLLDNASCHGKHGELPELQNVTVLFLPARTISILQPLDRGIIAVWKKKYQGKVIMRSVQLLEGGVHEDLYKIDVRTAMTWVCEVWSSIAPTIIYNCFTSSGLI